VVCVGKLLITPHCKISPLDSFVHPSSGFPTAPPCEGGALVSVVPPQNTPEPENIIPIIRYDSAYVIRVDENGGWSFLPTSVLKGILERQGVIASDAEYRAKFNVEEKKPSAQSVQGNTGTAANNSSQGQ